MKIFKWIVIIGLTLPILAYAALWLYFTIEHEVTKITIDDPGVKPYLEAIEASSDIRHEGLLPIPDNPDYILIDDDGPEATSFYDWDARIVFIDGHISKGVCFMRTETGLKWLGEHDHIDGPDKWKENGVQHGESLLINYEIYPVTGHATNELVVWYSGRDPRMKDGTIKGMNRNRRDVDFLLEEWKTK